MNEQLSVIGTGGWRMVWNISRAIDKLSSNNVTQEFVLKTIKGEGGHFDFDAYNRHVIDAVITERLSSSPHVVDIYGHCAQSVFNELAHGSLSRIIKRNKKNKNKKGQGTLSSIEKLKFARDISQGLADMHSIDGENNATAVYKDLKPSNVVVSKNGKLKISDFNDAHLLMWNSSSHSQCRFRRKRWTPHFHSPEEVLQRPLSEKVDVYALGGVIFYILVGYKPYDHMDVKDVFMSIVRGKKPHLPKEYAKSPDPVVISLIQVMNKCHRSSPDDRPSAMKISEELNLALVKEGT
eukprot:CAMPEP_0195540496 /NCGR_PEP_ID=MMETSP0794_2-20130614/50602_1 /TAXON_ID=515487 /ORGANISM="Stephanopyxis turris, Strain CCMP 815" /LENGTH=293 /DNA_ID=CAMNT_0040674565 /DNA_START=48 /DNA_END=929 /DNA_ORIENTATION=+